MSSVMMNVESNPQTLAEHVAHAVRTYMKTSNNLGELDLYELILEEVEAPLFRSVMELTRYNQSKAARVLGLSRGTLRTKLKHYFGDEFIGTR